MNTTNSKTYEIDATDKALGRLATEVANLLRGKNLASYNPRILPTTSVTILNIDKIRFTGKKFTDKEYYRYSGYPGGLKTRTLEALWTKSPREVVRKVIYRMLPVNRSRDKIIRNLHFK